MGAVDTTYTFTATDTITSAKMNNIIDQTTMTSSAIIGTTLDVASGQLKVRSQGITSNEMGTSSVTTDAIANGAVTPAKLSAGGPSWDGAGGTLTLSSRAIELGNGITSNTASYIDFHSSFPIIDNDARIIRESGTNGTLTISNIGTGAIVMSASSGVTFASANMPNPSGDAPLYSVRAFAKVATNGAVANNKGFSSISKTGTGTYNLILAVTPAEDPIVVATCHTPSGNNFNYSAAVQINASNNFTVKTGFEDTNSLRDMAFSIMVIY
jgi:hypothetical protein